MPGSSTIPATNKPAEIRALAGARAIPPLLLVLYHYHEGHGYQHVRWFDVLVAKGYLWVEFFFALSGFILVHVYGSGNRNSESGDRSPSPASPAFHAASPASPKGQGDLKRRHFRYLAFLKVRLARLYPLQLTTLLIMLGMVVLLRWLAARGGYVSIYDEPGYHPYTSVWSFIGNLFLVQAWHIFPHLSWNGVAWFVSVEWFLCLIFPLFLWIARGGVWRGFAEIAFGLALLSLLIHLSKHGLDMTYDWGIARGLGDFSVGAGMAILYRAWKPRAEAAPALWHSAAQLFVFTAFFYAIYNTGWSHTPRDYWVLPPMFALVLALSFDRGIVARAFQSKPLRLLGEWSFAIYMGQTTFLQLLRFFEQRIYPDAAPEWSRTIHILEPAALVIVCTAWGACLYYAIERPANVWLRRKLIGRRKAGSAPA